MIHVYEQLVFARAAAVWEPAHVHFQHPCTPVMNVCAGCEREDGGAAARAGKAAQRQ